METSKSSFTFADEYPELSLVARFRLNDPLQIRAETLSVQFALGWKCYKS